MNGHFGAFVMEKIGLQWTLKVKHENEGYLILQIYISLQDFVFFMVNKVCIWKIVTWRILWRKN